MQFELPFESADGEARAPGNGARAVQRRTAQACEPRTGVVAQLTALVDRLQQGRVQRSEARRAVRVVAENQGLLLAWWERIHG